MTYTITHTLTNLSKGNMTFVITPAQGYSLPATSSGITVTNGTLVSYDNTTGTIVVSGDDTTTISVTCPVISQGFNHIYISKHNHSSGLSYYKLNDGSQTEIPSSADIGYDVSGSLSPSQLQDLQTKSVDLTNVSKLEVMAEDADCIYYIFDTNGTLVTYGFCTWVFVDITQYLQEGYFVYIEIWD